MSRSARPRTVTESGHRVGDAVSVSGRPLVGVITQISLYSVVLDHEVFVPLSLIAGPAEIGDAEPHKISKKRGGKRDGEQLDLL